MWGGREDSGGERKLEDKMSPLYMFPCRALPVWIQHPAGGAHTRSGHNN